MRALPLLAAVLVAGGSITSCKSRCDGNLDCGNGSYCSGAGRCEIDCFDDHHCRVPVECQAKPENCPSKGLYCTQRGKCVGDLQVIAKDGAPEVPRAGPSEGWNSPVGTGPTFIMNRLALLGDGHGFNIDHKPGIDNIFHPIAPLVNHNINQGVQAGEVLILIEIAGLDEPYTGFDDSVTIRFYGAIDADRPRYSHNNFKAPFDQPGRCCEFKIDLNSVTSDDDGTRIPIDMVPAYIDSGRIFTQRRVSLEFLLTVGPQPYPLLHLDRTVVEFDLDSDLRTLSRGALGGAFRASDLANIANPFCSQQGPRCPSGDPRSTILDMVSPTISPTPDIDLDGDGAECALMTTGQTIDLCCDGAGSDDPCSVAQRSCEGAAIPSIDQVPGHCARNADFADGYSAALEFTAVSARVVGFGSD